METDDYNSPEIFGVMRRAMMEQMIASNAAKEKQQFAEVRSHVLDRGEYTVFMKEMDDQEPSDRAEMVIGHHLGQVCH